MVKSWCTSSDVNKSMLSAEVGLCEPVGERYDVLVPGKFACNGSVLRGHDVYLFRCAAEVRRQVRIVKGV